MLDDVKLMLTGRDKTHNNLRAFVIDDPGMIEDAKAFLHAHQPTSVLEGNFEGRPAKLAVGDLDKYLPVDALQRTPTVTTASSRGSPRQGGGPRGALGYRGKTQDDEAPVPEQFVET